MNVAAMLGWSAARNADRLAFETADGERTYGEVDSRANALANALIELGVGKGDRIGVLVGNQLEYPETEFGIAKAGAVRVPMLITSSTEEVQRYVEYSEADVVFASEQGLPALRAANERLGGAVTVIAIGATEAGEMRYEELVGAGSARAPEVDLLEADPYALRFTGGTTGTPKGILMDHRCMTHVIDNMLLNWDVRDDDVVCQFHPLSHAAGKLMYTWWMRGARQVILPAFNFRAEELLATIERARVTTMFMIPTALNVLLDSKRLADSDTSSLRTVIYGGAPIPARRIEEGLWAFGPVFSQIYGCSEAPNVLTCLTPEDHLFPAGEEPPARLRSAGRIAFGVEVRVVDAEGADTRPGEVGEIISRGPHTMAGYWKNEDLNAERVRDGWIYTRDMGTFDADGYLYVVDRKDDVIITGGFNVWPAEIEDVLCAIDGVAEAAVFGAADEKWGEAVTAVVVPKEGVSLDERDLDGLTREALPGHKRPKRILVRREPIPKSPVHKPLRRKLRDEYAAAEPAV